MTYYVENITIIAKYYETKKVFICPDRIKSKTKKRIDNKFIKKELRYMDEIKRELRYMNEIKKKIKIHE